jgi:hypothetical protein
LGSNDTSIWVPPIELPAEWLTDQPITEALDGLKELAGRKAGEKGWGEPTDRLTDTKRQRRRETKAQKKEAETGQAQG